MQKLAPYVALMLLLGAFLVSCSTEPLHAPHDPIVLKTKINFG
ncbi:hypothetical protein [Rickettsiella endosymbiont of Dermanyssus gallinae]|nr:hypothetical protein [Rickettsiella endosymbiont of Dermanyssus gallinae]